MRRVILTIGPQYAGKSTFCQAVVKACPNLIYISRDAILMEMFGTVWLDSYSGGHYVAQDRMWKLVAHTLGRTDVLILLDTWNGGAEERANILLKLRDRGADRIEGWYFTTPLDQCQAWRTERQRQERGGEEEKDERWRKIMEDQRASSYAGCYEFYHRQQITEEGGFDQILQINPLVTKPDRSFRRLAGL